MIEAGSLEYAHARLGARFGARPDELAWRRIEMIRDLGGMLDAARATVAGARAEATAIAERARESVRRLAMHTDRRIHRIRAAFAATTTAEVEGLEAQAAALGVATGLTPAEVARVDAAVAALARALTEAAP